MPNLQWDDLAQEDLLAIVEYIAADNPEAAWALKNEIEKKASHVCIFPRSYKAGKVGGTREMVVRDNYIVVYNEDAENVLILRVLHAARVRP